MLVSIRGENFLFMEEQIEDKCLSQVPLPDVLLLLILKTFLSIKIGHCQGVNNSGNLQHVALI